MRGDEHDLVIGLDQELVDDLAVLGRAVEGFDALAAAVGLAVELDPGALAVAVARDDEHLAPVFAHDVERLHSVLAAQSNGANATAGPSHRAHGILIEADCEPSARR